MTRFFTLPVVAIGKDRDGLPTRLSVPGLTKTVPIRSDGRRIGEVAPSGAVTWEPPGAAESIIEFEVQAGALDQVRWSRRKLRAAVVDDKVVAVVVPKRRAPKARS